MCNKGTGVFGQMFHKRQQSQDMQGKGGVTVSAISQRFSYSWVKGPQGLQTYAQVSEIPLWRGAQVLWLTSCLISAIDFLGAKVYFLKFRDPVLQIAMCRSF